MKRDKRELKETIQFASSLLVLIAGIALVFIGLFLQPVGVIHYTVLSAFGMFLTFVGAVWQLDVKYTFKTEEMRNQMRVEMDNNEKRYKKRIDEATEEDYNDIDPM